MASGSGAFGKSENDSSQNSNFNQNVWGGQAPFLQSMYGQAGNMFNQGIPGMLGSMNKGASMMPQIPGMMNPAWQNQMQGGAYSGMDLTGAMNQSINNLNNYDTQTGDLYAQIMGGQGNTYADAMKDSLTADAQRAMDLGMAGLDQRAAASGMSGSSRHGVAQGLLMNDVNQNLQSNLADIGFSSFDKDLQNKLNIAQMADANKLQALTQNQNTIGNMMGGSQNAMAGGLNFGNNMFGMGQQMQMLPWQLMAGYSGTLGAPTVLGSGTSAGSSSGKGFGLGGGFGSMGK